ncbi:MAG: sporulation integral membrane protein YtvI [Ruminiclostridium sp.]|nr:sporulation integral membrane protein YtvI [Ruminiclostridium sp.]
MKIPFESDMKRILIILAVTAAVVFATLAAFKLAVLLAPFIIALILSSLIEPVICIAEKKLKLGRKAAVPLILSLMIAIPGYLSFAIITRLIYEVKSFVLVLPAMLSRLYVQLRNLIDSVSNMHDWPPELAGSLESLYTSLTSAISRLADTLFKGAFATAVSLPEALIFVLITVISTFFMSSDRELIVGYFHKQLPDRWVKKIRSIKNDMFSALFGYLKAVMILMAITFFELFIGLPIINVAYALLLAVIIAVIDALPIVGTGSILVPWSLFCYVSGNYRLGTSILILYLVTLIVRQLIEPKILSRQIGVHPLMALASMYVGLKLAGFTGLVLGPLIFLLIKSIINGIQRKNP